MIDMNLSNSSNNNKSSKPENNNAISNIKSKGSNIAKKSKAEKYKAEEAQLLITSAIKYYGKDFHTIMRANFRLK